MAESVNTAYNVLYYVRTYGRKKPALSERLLRFARRMLDICESERAAHDLDFNYREDFLIIRK